jgi:hypothetical protein
VKPLQLYLGKLIQMGEVEGLPMAPASFQQTEPLLTGKAQVS